MGTIIAGLLAAAVVAPSPLHYEFKIERARGVMFNPWTLTDDPVELRSYIGSGANPGDFVAPTIRAAPGQRLTIDLDNRLEACTEAQRRDHLCFNDTNLHTHGLWISPSGNSDNVMVSIAPGEKFRYQYDIPAEHPAGTFWYHPHRHGTGVVQVGSGMAGALIVTGNRLPTADRPGDIDILLKDERGRPMAERTLIFQHTEYGCLDEKGIPAGKRDADNLPLRPFTCDKGQTGQIENFETDWGWDRTGRFMGINGRVQPVIGKVQAGQFERWRLVNAGTGGTARLRLYHLDPAAPDLKTVRADDQIAWRQRYCTGAALPMWQIALDGLTRSTIRKSDESSVFPGERMDILVNLPSAGRYCLVHDTRKPDTDKDNPSRMLAVVEAVGQARQADTVDDRLQVNLSKAAERVLSDPAVRGKVLADLRDGLKLSSFVWHKSIPKEEVSGYREAILNVLDAPDDIAFRINGLSHDEHRIDAVLPLGKTEEWRAASLNEGHPLHIHVNPFQIISIKDVEGRDMADPASPAYDPDYGGMIGQWKDTILVKENARIAFRTRYERFTGDFVMHCHIMYHGDHGMMQNLRIAAEGEAAPEHPGH